MPKHDDPTEIEPRPAIPRAPDGRSTLDQLRADIDSGATGDKVPMLDPAASPLGTDDEAAGASPSPGLIAATRRAERVDATRRSPLDPTGGPQAGRTARRLAYALLLVAVLGVGAAWIGLSG